MWFQGHYCLFFGFAGILMIFRIFFGFLISLKKNNSKIEIWCFEKFRLELEIVVSAKWQNNKQTISRLHLETAARGAELYPCICFKLSSLQAFLPAKSVIPLTTPKSQGFLKNCVVKSAIFWVVGNCRKHIGCYSWRYELSVFNVLIPVVFFLFVKYHQRGHWIFSEYYTTKTQ